MSQMLQRVVLLPDFHYPYHNKVAVNAVFKFIRWFKPHTVVILGDGMEMSSINHWKQEHGSKKFFESKRLLKEYEGFDKEILTPLEKICEHSDKRRKEVEKIYMGGNHEDWVNTLIDKNPQLEGLVEPEIVLKLKERNWKWIPFVKINGEGNVSRGIVKFGKLLVFHGQYWNKYHSSKTADEYSRSCAYAHTHDIQLYTKVFSDDCAGYHTAQSIGCLCSTSPAFKRGKGNRWVNAFGVLYVRDDGMYNLYVPVIIRGKFVFSGKEFDGNK